MRDKFVPAKSAGGFVRKYLIISARLDDLGVSSGPDDLRAGRARGRARQGELLLIDGV